MLAAFIGGFQARWGLWEPTQGSAGGEGSALQIRPPLHLVYLTASVLAAYTLGYDQVEMCGACNLKFSFGCCLVGFVLLLRFSFLICSFMSIPIVLNCYDIFTHMLHMALGLYS